MLTDADFQGRRVVVMGLGRFGGGVGVTRFLAERGARVLVTDMAPAQTLEKSIRACDGFDIAFRLGEHQETDLAGAELLVVSPAIDRRKSAFFQAAVAWGIPWTTEMNLFLERCPGRIVGVTGSIGKSTTCAMAHAILSDPAAAAGAGVRRALLGGNIGESLLSSLGDITADDAVVLELSSFQLECVADTAFRPEVAGLTNARPHHLDRHGDFDAYLDAKLNLFRKQSAGDVVVVATDDACVCDRVRGIQRACGSRYASAVHAGQKYDLQVPGGHNQANAHMAVVLATALGVDEAAARQAVGRFTGLPHRLELVATVDRVRYFNDSKSTSAEAVTTALAALADPVVLLIGGKDIGEELDRVVESPWGHVRAVVCFGDAGPRLAELLQQNVASQHGCTVESIPALSEATARARALAHPGDVVILSPGCPSYDAFTNYEQRGAAFTLVVQSWTKS